MMDKNKLNKMLGVALLVMLGVFVVTLVIQLSSLLHTPQKGACNVQVCLKKFLDGPPSYNDEYMARFLQTKYMTPPSSGPLNLSNNNDGTNKEFEEAKVYLAEHFKDKRNGKFLVLGAGDGEYLDQSLDLERNLGWTGLLVESLPVQYEQLKKKKRNAELSTACVSPFSYPAQVKMAYPAFEGLTNEKDKLLRFRETKLRQLWTENYQFIEEQVQCIPLANIVYASSVITDKIDFLVLDMAGSDLDILLTTNLDWIPDTDMVMVVSHGTDVATEIGGYFMEKNMVVSKVFGSDAKNARFIITKFQADASLVDL